MDLTRLKRFDKAKHEQLEGLLQWCQLMGLTGKDLVSLGGHIDRVQTREKAQSNRAAVDAMGCQPIGKDSRIDDRWKLVTGGVTYWFETDYHSVKITNTQTKMSRRFRVDSYAPELGRMHWRRRMYYVTMLEVMDGKIRLDF